MSATAERQRLARIALGLVAEPGDLARGGLLRCCEPAQIMAALSSGDDPGTGLPPARRELPGLTQAFRRWRPRRDQVPSPARLSAWEGIGLRLVCPVAPQWPARLDDLGEARPVVLWLRGNADLRHACLRSVSVVGSRASTAYGNHVCAEMAAALAERGWAVISGGPEWHEKPNWARSLLLPSSAQDSDLRSSLNSWATRRRAVLMEIVRRRRGGRAAPGRGDGAPAHRGRAVHIDGSRRRGHCPGLDRHHQGG